MSGRRSLIQQREAKQILKAAKQAGAKKVEFLIDKVPVIVHLDGPPDEKPAPDTWDDAVAKLETE